MQSLLHCGMVFIELIIFLRIKFLRTVLIFILTQFCTWVISPVAYVCISKFDNPDCFLLHHIDYLQCGFSNMQTVFNKMETLLFGILESNICFIKQNWIQLAFHFLCLSTFRYIELYQRCCGLLSDHVISFQCYPGSTLSSVMK